MVRMGHPIFHVSQQQQLGGSSSDGEEGGLTCKLGSLQQFVPHDCDTSEMGASRFRCVELLGRWAGR